MTLAFDAETHTYTVEGRVYPSVTQVIRAAGLMGKWMPTDPFYVERGSMVHLATELCDKELLDWETVDPRISGYMAAWVQYRTDHRISGFEFIEKRFYSAAYQYCGTLDRPSLDIKTGESCPWHIVQAAAYARLSGSQAQTWTTVYLREDGTYKLAKYSVKELFEAWKVFLAALQIYNWRKANNVS